MGHIKDRLSDYHDFTKKLADDHQMFLASDVSEMIEQLQDDLKQDEKENGWILASADVMIWTVMNMRRSVRNMKLIDADLLEKQMNKEVLHLFNSMYTGYVKAMKCVKQQSTAFDVDKVVKQLDKASDYYEFDEQGKERVQMINLTEAIEIVKGGGVE